MKVIVIDVKVTFIFVVSIRLTSGIVSPSECFHARAAERRDDLLYL